MGATKYLSMKVFVGSTNPAKINAAKKVFEKVFGQIEVEGMKTESGVNAQPMNDNEIIQGAVNRAVMAYQKNGFGVGLEGGIIQVQTVYYTKGWVAITDGKKTGLASTVSIPLPNSIVSRVLEGVELGEVIDKLEGRKGIGKKEGVIGLLTKNNVTRTDFFEQALFCALAPFYNAEAYKGGFGR